MENKPDRIEYVCNSYHRYGKEHCTPHRINEIVLDEIIYAELLNIKEQAEENFKQIDAKLNLLKQNKSLSQNNTKLLKEQLSQRKSDQQEIKKEKIFILKCMRNAKVILKHYQKELLNWKI